MVSLPHMLTKTRFSYRSTSSGSRAGGFSSCSEAVQYILRTYAAETAIGKATDSLELLRKMPKKRKMRSNPVFEMQQQHILVEMCIPTPPRRDLSLLVVYEMQNGRQS